MKIPHVTDQELDKVLDLATSPVAVTFLGSPDPARNALWRNRMEAIASDLDDRVIFLFVNAMENPTPALAWRAMLDGDGADLPVLIVFRRGDEYGRSICAARCTIEELILRALVANREGRNL